MLSSSKSLTPHAITLTTYAELATYAAAFADGHLKSVVLIGPPGIGKSTEFRRALGPRTCWISGNASAFGIYLAAYEHLDDAIVLDDVDDLHRNPHGIRLLKALCQTDPVRTISWTTRAPELDRRGVPRKFETTSPVALIANDWSSVGPNVAAVEDRMHLLVFQPTPLEIHRQAATWFWDQEIFDFVAGRLGILERQSLRLYVRAFELKAAGMDWKSAVLRSCFRGAALTVAQLKCDPSFPTEEARVQAFVSQGHGCRATYFNHAKRVQPVSDVPAIALTQSAAPTAADGDADLLEFLQRRHGRLGNG